MKIMIVPMAAMAETHGPVSRCRVFTYGFKEAGFDVATCMAKDMNYREITAFIYNRLSNAGYGDAKSLSLEVFNVFIFVGALAAVGYGIMVLLMFIDSVKGKIYPFKWMWFINPFVFMVISIVLSKILPQNAFTNGVFGLGQQSIGLFIVFVVLCFTTEDLNRG